MHEIALAELHVRVVAVPFVSVVLLAVKVREGDGMVVVGGVEEAVVEAGETMRVKVNEAKRSLSETVAVIW